MPETRTVERRRHTRVRVQRLHAAYRPAGLLSLLAPRADERRAEVLDISEGGLRVLVSRPLKERAFPGSS